MNCRKYPPFYEVEQNGVCVKNPPNVPPDTAKDYIITGVLIMVLFGGIIYTVNTITKQ
jgi:hypothetical protein